MRLWRDYPQEEAKPHKVEVWEYEQGWGSKIDFMRGFDTLKQADDYVREFNAKNTAKEMPSWYMVARRQSCHTWLYVFGISHLGETLKAALDLLQEVGIVQTQDAYTVSRETVFSFNKPLDFDAASLCSARLVGKTQL